MLNNGIKKALSLCLLLAFVVGLSACSAAPHKSESYTSSTTGSTMMLDNDRESCTRSCNAEMDRCGDTNAAQEQVGRGQLTGVFGGRADCRNDLRACLARCRSR